MGERNPHESTMVSKLEEGIQRTTGSGDHRRNSRCILSSQVDRRCRRHPESWSLRQADQTAGARTLTPTTTQTAGTRTTVLAFRMKNNGSSEKKARHECERRRSASAWWSTACEHPSNNGFRWAVNPSFSYNFRYRKEHHACFYIFMHTLVRTVHGLDISMGRFYDLSHRRILVVLGPNQRAPSV
jgi:hypothetical protein